jgi:hypothetical protein
MQDLSYQWRGEVESIFKYMYNRVGLRSNETIRE